MISIMTTHLTVQYLTHPTQTSKGPTCIFTILQNFWHQQKKWNEIL